MAGGPWAALFAGLGLWLAPPAAGAAPFVQSIAIAITEETGEDAGANESIEETAAPGATVAAIADVRCPGTSPCVVLPDAPRASASAETDFGVNRARAFAPADYDVNAENDVYDTAAATSYWVDEWTFSGTGGGPVSIEFTIDGGWENGGFAEFAAAVADSTLPPIVDPDETEPPLLDGQLVGPGIGFDTSGGVVFTGVPPFFIPLPDAGEPDGDLDLTLTLVFTPIPDRMYLVGARLIVGTNPEFAFSEAAFAQTARVSRVVVPTGMTLSSAGTYQVVPEPGMAALLLAAIGALGAATRALRRH
jgi:hypothetical protein